MVDPVEGDIRVNRTVTYVDAVLEARDAATTLAEHAIEGLELMGDGYPDSVNNNQFFSRGNTLKEGPYFTARCNQAYAIGLEFMQSEYGGTPLITQLVRVEWPREIFTDGEWQPYPYEPITYAVPEYDEAGTVVGMRQQEIARIR